jgi:hypothetical protein
MQISDVVYISIINSTLLNLYVYESGSTVNILWRIDPLLGKDSETNNGTTAVSRQQPLPQSVHVGTPAVHPLQWRVTVRNGVFYSVRAKGL